jgi:hypothetical protein
MYTFLIIAKPLCHFKLNLYYVVGLFEVGVPKKKKESKIFVRLPFANNIYLKTFK